MGLQRQGCDEQESKPNAFKHITITIVVRRNQGIEICKVYVKLLDIAETRNNILHI